MQNSLILHLRTAAGGCSYTPQLRRQASPMKRKADCQCFIPPQPNILQILYSFFLPSPPSCLPLGLAHPSAAPFAVAVKFVAPRSNPLAMVASERMRSASMTTKLGRHHKPKRTGSKLPVNRRAMAERVEFEMQSPRTETGSLGLHNHWLPLSHDRPREKPAQFENLRLNVLWTAAPALLPPS